MIDLFCTITSDHSYTASRASGESTKAQPISPTVDSQESTVTNLDPRDEAELAALLDELDRVRYSHQDSVSYLDVNPVLESGSFETLTDGNRNPLSNQKPIQFDTSNIPVTIGYRPMRRRRHVRVPETADQLFHSLYYNREFDGKITDAESVIRAHEPLPGCSFWDDAITREMWKLRPIFPAYATMTNSINVAPTTPCVSVASSSDDLVEESPHHSRKHTVVSHAHTHPISPEEDSAVCEVPIKRSRLTVIENPNLS